MSLLSRYMFFVLAGLASAPIPTGAIAAEQKYAIAQYDNGNGAKLIVVQGFRAAECQKLIDTFYAGLRLDCPACRKDYGGCTNDIENYRAVWQNRNFIAPYVSSGTNRFIYLGIARSEAEAACNTQAERLRSAGLEATCIK